MNELLNIGELPELGDTPRVPTGSLVVHFLAPLTVPIDRFHSRVVYWGYDLIVTDEMRESGKDRNGNSWLDLLGDEDAQIKRWGEVTFREGPWPDDLPHHKPGSFEYAEARERARQAAWTLIDPEERAWALAKVNEDFGPPPLANTTIQESN